MRTVVFIYGHGCQSGCRVRLKADAGRSLRPKFLKCLALVQGQNLPIKSETNSSNRTSSVLSAEFVSSKFRATKTPKLAEIPRADALQSGAQPDTFVSSFSCLTLFQVLCTIVGDLFSKFK
jgi:hypothetical protein